MANNSNIFQRAINAFNRNVEPDILQGTPATVYDAVIYSPTYSSRDLEIISGSFSDLASKLNEHIPVKIHYIENGDPSYQADVVSITYDEGDANEGFSFFVASFDPIRTDKAFKEFRWDETGVHWSDV